MSKEKVQTETVKKSKFAFLKTAAFPWILIILAIYGGGMFIFGWNSRSTDQAQFDGLTAQIQEIKDLKVLK